MKTSSYLKQAGVGHVVLIFAVVFLAVAGLAGWQVMNNNKADEASSVTLRPKAPEKIESKADLVQTSKYLDSTSSQLDSGLNDSALNADLNDML